MLAEAHQTGNLRLPVLFSLGRGGADWREHGKAL